MSEMSEQQQTTEPIEATSRAADHAAAAEPFTARNLAVLESRAGVLALGVRGSIATVISAVLEHHDTHHDTAALARIAWGFAMDEFTVDDSDEQRPETRAVLEALVGTLDQLNDLAQLGACVDAMLEDVPTLESVPGMLTMALADHDRAARRVKDAAVRWGDLALTGPALKAACIADLMDPAAASPDGTPRGLSRSAAEKAVTSHPRYAVYREKLDAYAREKIDRETDVTAARLRVETLTEVSKTIRAIALAQLATRENT